MSKHEGKTAIEEWDDERTLVVPASHRALSQQVLRTDVAGMPLEWIDYREAARLYHMASLARSTRSHARIVPNDLPTP